jgi:hypothetical protein
VKISNLIIYQIKLVIKTAPGLGDSSGVGQHANGTLNLGKITSGHDGRGLKISKLSLRRFSIFHSLV